MREAAIFFISMLFSALAVVLVTLILRHRTQQMLHQERLASLEKGTAIPAMSEPAPWSPRVYLLRGLIWSFTGAALVIAMVFLALASERPQSASDVAYHARDISRNLDIPLEQARQMAEKDEAANIHRMPPSVALLGLIPLGVGLAYLVFYCMDDSRKHLAEADAHSVEPRI